MSDIDKCVSFTGYRPEKIIKSSSNPNIEQEIRKALGVTIRRLYDEGYRSFCSGMAEGFDMWAAEEVLLLRDNGVCPEISLTAVIPFSGQPLRFPGESQIKYKEILSLATDKVVLAKDYYRGCYETRNNYLIDNASLIICYFDGQPGGTKYTVTNARRRGLRVINLFEPMTLF